MRSDPTRPRVSLEQLSQTDKRPPVLFLRSFLDDQVDLARPRAPLWHRIVAVGEPAPTLDYVLLEEATPLGPVVAIGVPGSPPPFGAARTYFDDGEWQSAVAKLAETARAIVIVVDDTEGVRWELAHIRHAGHMDKTLLLLPPRLSAPAEAIRIIQREFADPDGIGDAVAASYILGTGSTPCVGWHQDSGGALSLFTTAHPSVLSYMCAIRLFFRKR